MSFSVFFFSFLFHFSIELNSIRFAVISLRFWLENVWQRAKHRNNEFHNSEIYHITHISGVTGQSLPTFQIH